MLNYLVLERKMEIKINISGEKSGGLDSLNQPKKGAKSIDILIG